MKSPAEAAAILSGKPSGKRARPKAPPIKLLPMPPIDAPIDFGLTLIVDGPPQPKQRSRPGRFGFFTPKETMAYQRHVATAARAELARLGIAARWPLDRYYRLTVYAWFPDARRKDADNVAKSVADALNSVLWRDDSQALDIEARRRIDRDNPRTEVRVEVLAP